VLIDINSPLSRISEKSADYTQTRAALNGDVQWHCEIIQINNVNVDFIINCDFV